MSADDTPPMPILTPTPEQDSALARLVAQGTISDQQARAVRQALWAPGQAERPKSGGAAALIEVAGYAGGGLMLAGATLLVGLAWEELSQQARVATLAGATAVLLLAALVIAGGPKLLATLRPTHSPRRRLVASLCALAAIPAALAGGVAVDVNEPLVAGIAGLVVAIVGYATLPSAPGLLVTSVASMLTVFGALDAVDHAGATPSAYAMIGLGVFWSVATRLGLAQPRGFGWGIGAGLTIYGAQMFMGEPGTRPLAYAVTLAVAVISFLLYGLERAAILLVAGVVATTIGVPEAVSDLTNGALSGPAVLLIAGAVLIGASALGLRLRHERHSRVNDAETP